MKTRRVFFFFCFFFTLSLSLSPHPCILILELLSYPETPPQSKLSCVAQA